MYTALLPRVPRALTAQMPDPRCNRPSHSSPLSTPYPRLTSPLYHHPHHHQPPLPPGSRVAG
jgi:hypothetical protein